MFNIYSDSNQSAFKYLKNTEANIQNVLVITGDFNIRDSNWDPLYLFHSTYSDLLVDIAGAFDLFFSHLTKSVPTRQSNNENSSNSVINLMFLRPNSMKFDSYTIFPELHYLSDYALLVVDIHIMDEFI